MVILFSIYRRPLPEADHGRPRFKVKIQGKGTRIFPPGGSQRRADCYHRAWQAYVGNPSLWWRQTRSFRDIEGVGAAFGRSLRAGRRSGLGSAYVIVLDTHVLVWWLGVERKRLSAPALKSIERELASDEVIVSSISAWEIAMLVQRNKL